MALNVRGRTPKSAGHVTGYGTLAGFPMERSHVDTVRTMEKRREVAQKQQTFIGRATATSDKLRRYSKMLFDEALGGATRVSSATSGDASLPSISSPDRSHVPAYVRDVGASGRDSSSRHAHRGVMTSSGPSYFGSPIYNRRAMLLNDIRLWPKSGTRARSRDENGVNADIRLILTESNVKYRVVPSTAGSVTSRQQTYSHASGYPEYLLVPRDGATTAEAETTSADVSHLDTSDGQLVVPPTGNGLESRNCDSDSGSIELDLATGSQDVQRIDPEINHQGNPDGQTDGDPENDPDSENRKQTDVDGTSNSLASTTTRSVYRKVTWVDELTVSTPEGVSNAEPSATSGDVCANGRAESIPIDEKKAEVRRVMNLNDLRRNAWNLPDFICPSSEEKSKQARMAVWLQATNFTTGRKTVPLL